MGMFEFSIADVEKRLIDMLLAGDRDDKAAVQRLIGRCEEVMRIQDKIARASAEVAEGLASFHEKRPPDYDRLRTDIEERGSS